MQNEDNTFAFPRAHRLHGKLTFAAVYDAKAKCAKGPLLAFSLPNDLGHARLGLSVSRRVGIAPVRNRIKRLLREAFRLDASKPAMDFILVVRPHVPMKLPEYQSLATQLFTHSQQLWQRRNNDV